jgi:hypothetical protein
LDSVPPAFQIASIAVLLAGCSASPSAASPAAAAPDGAPVDTGARDADVMLDAPGDAQLAPVDATGDVGAVPYDAQGDAGGVPDGSQGDAAAGHGGFVYVCGTSLCLDGAPFRVKGATAYGTLDAPAAEIALAQQANVSTLELVEFETQYHQLSDAMSEATWKRVDAFVAAVASAGMHVILNLSSYGQSLAAAGQTPTVVDWNAYVSFIATRTNTVSHRTYASDPTIAMIEIWGEIPPPDGQGTDGTPQQMTSFYHRTLAELHASFPHHIASTGGFSYLNESNAAGIDWKTIMQDPADDVCAVEINSQGDRDVTVPMVSAFCQGLGKPWFLSAWSACVGKPAQFTGDIDHFSTDAEAAAHAQDMYHVAADTNVTGQAPSMAAVGSDFWNLGPKQAPTCDVNPGFAQTFAVVQVAH